VANAEMKVSFLAAVRRGAVLTCDAVVVSGGSRTAFVEASITDHDDRLVARASSTYLYRDRK
jgi:acyl-coenzyme A thioesterase PaaI-like protein